MARVLFQGEPLAFDGRDALLQYLRSSVVTAAVEDFLSRPTWTLAKIANDSVDVTTARAIHTGKRYGVAPLRLLRTWAHAYLGQHWRDFVEAPDARAYQAALDAAVDSLQAEFAEKTAPRARELSEEPYALTYGRAAKMIALMLKHVALFDQLSSEEGRSFFGRVHVALDRYTLAPVAQLGRGLGLPRRPSMGDVQTRDAYLAVQGWVAAVCEDADVPLSTYEVALFNLPRGVWYAKPALLDLNDVPKGVSSMASSNGPAQTRSRPRPASTRRVDGAGPKSVGVAAERPTRPSPRRASGPAQERARAAGPTTAPWARVIAHRTATNACAIEVNADGHATHRNAPITGFIEVVDARDLEVARAETGERQVRARLTWFGRSPQCGYVKVKLTGVCIVHDGFSGEVVADLGDPAEPAGASGGVDDAPERRDDERPDRGRSGRSSSPCSTTRPGVARRRHVARPPPHVARVHEDLVAARSDALAMLRLRVPELEGARLLISAMSCCPLARGGCTIRPA